MDSTLNQNKTLFFVFVTFLVLALFLFPELAFAKDYAAGAKKDIQDTFGPGSTAWWTVMVLEVFAAAFLYIKTKNLAVFGGIIALMLFGNIAFGLF